MLTLSDTDTEMQFLLNLYIADSPSQIALSPLED